MAGYETWHWRTFNVLVRLFGLAALMVGAVVLATGPWWLGIVVIAMGVAFMTVRPYRPDLGDVERLIEPQEFAGNSKARRRWWTGDRQE
jgi:membrane protein implicated in regulation of membrane protease activity